MIEEDRWKVVLVGVKANTVGSVTPASAAARFNFIVLEKMKGVMHVYLVNGMTKRENRATPFVCLRDGSRS